MLGKRRGCQRFFSIHTLGHGVSPKPLISMFVNIIAWDSNVRWHFSSQHKCLQTKRTMQKWLGTNAVTHCVQPPLISNGIALIKNYHSSVDHFWSVLDSKKGWILVVFMLNMKRLLDEMNMTFVHNFPEIKVNIHQNCFVVFRKTNTGSTWLSY